MICEDCKNKSITRGMKTIYCVKCGKATAVNYAFQDICDDCSNKFNICQYCGKPIVASKPPLGVMPLHIFEEQRAIELARAIYEYLQYKDKDYEQLTKWVEELKNRIWNLKSM